MSMLQWGDGNAALETSEHGSAQGPWRAMIPPDPAVLPMLRCGYLELPPQRPGLTLSILTSLLTSMEATKSFLVPLEVRPLIEIPVAGWSSYLPHLPWRVRKILTFNFQTVEKKACLRTYFLLIANGMW